MSIETNCSNSIYILTFFLMVVIALLASGKTNADNRIAELEKNQTAVEPRCFSIYIYDGGSVMSDGIFLKDLSGLDEFAGNNPNTTVRICKGITGD